MNTKEIYETLVIQAHISKSSICYGIPIDILRIIAKNVINYYINMKYIDSS